jgi:hypothetical protein
MTETPSSAPLKREKIEKNIFPEKEKRKRQNKKIFVFKKERK